MLSPSDRSYISYNVAIHSNQQLLFRARRSFALIKLPEFILTNTSQYPLIFSTGHLLSECLTE